MTNKKVLVNIFAVLLVLFIFFLFLKQNDKQDFVRSLDADPVQYERVYQDYGALNTEELIDTTLINWPMHLKVINGDLYISDFSDFSIFILDDTGKKKRTIKTGKGRGPGEFENLTDFDVIRDTLWAVDIQNLRVSSFSLNNGEFLESFSVEHRPLRIATLDEGFVIQWLGADSLFSKFDYQGNELNQFGAVIEDQRIHMMSMSGEIRSAGTDRFVYLPYYASLVYQYKSDGELINVIRAPDGIEFPATDREGPRSHAPDFSFQRNAWLDQDNYLYVYTRLPGEKQSNQEWEGEPWGVFDKYNLITGEYKSSIPFEFTDNPFIAVFANGKIYSRSDEKIFFHQFSR